MRGHPLVAFSNGVEATVRALLDRAGILPRLQDDISVDDLKTFEPDPKVYRYLTRRLGTDPSGTWLVSSNPEIQFGPWDVEPHLVAQNLQTLAGRL